MAAACFDNDNDVDDVTASCVYNCWNIVSIGN